MNPNEFIHDLDQRRIVAAIRNAEARSRGEIRVHVDNHRVGDPRPAALAIFDELEMGNTKEKNAVLIFIAPKTARFAVLGDTGIDENVGDDFWASVADEIEGAFRRGDYTTGIVRAVERVGDVLAAHFPRRPGDLDVDELPDVISTG